MNLDDDNATGEYIAHDDFVSRFFLPSLPPVRVEFGAMSHRGLVRPNNEDHFLILRLRRSLSVLTTNLPEGQVAPQADEDSYAMIVADGMGGAASGELASMQAIRVGVDLMLSAVKWTMKFNEREGREFIEKLKMYVHLMDRALIESSRAEPSLAGMGTTLTVACSAGPVAFIVHAGDSRAYLLRGDTLQQLTRDHTLARELIDSGRAAPDSAAARRAAHVLTNYLGGDGRGGNAEIRQLVLADGDRLLLCTDGLTDLVGDEEIGRTLVLHPEPGDACRALVDLALGRGGRDNVTAVLGCYKLPSTMEVPPRPAESLGESTAVLE
jgi:serine/threonine protein phosphatase PrpC